VSASNDVKPGGIGGRFLRIPARSLGVLAVYYIAAIIALTINHWIPFKVTTGSVVIVVVILAPFIVSRVSQLSIGDFVNIQLREIGDKVDTRLAEVGSKVDDRLAEVGSKVDDRLAELINRSRDYLTPQPLSASDQKAEEMRKTINLSAQEVEAGLASFDPNLRVPTYIQLQVRPDSEHFTQLSGCFFLESYLASFQKETRPLWQLIVAVQACLGNGLNDELARNRLMLAMRNCLAYLESDDTVDTGGHCKKRLRAVLADLESH